MASGDTGADGQRLTRRAALRVSGVVGGTALAGCLGGLATRPSADEPDPIPIGDVSVVPDDPDVTMFQRGVRRHGYYGDEVVPRNVTVGWRRPINRDSHSAAKATPTPTPDGPVLIPADTGILHAVTPEGEELWTADLEVGAHGVHGTPAVADGTAFVGAYDGNLYAYDVESGRHSWTAELGDAIGASPAYIDGTVYITVEYDDPDGNLFAVDAATGEVEWVGTRPTDHPHSSPAIDPDIGRTVVGSNDGILYAWEYPSGRFAWRFETGGAIKGPIAIHEGAAIFGSWDHSVYAVDLEDGIERWSYETDDMVMSAPAIDPNEGVVYAGGHDHRFYSLDVETGEKRWSRHTGGRITGAPTITAGTVLVGSYDGYLYAFDKETGRRRWRVGHDGEVTSGIVPDGGRLYYSERGVFIDDETLVTPGRAYCLIADE